MIQLRRVYEGPGPHEGTRFLVERLWPRGIRKSELQIDGWTKEAGPSTELRKWFNHDPEKWDEFQRKYFAELDTRSEAWEPVLKAAERGTGDCNGNCVNGQSHSKITVNRPSRA